MKLYKLHNLLITPPENVTRFLQELHKETVNSFGNAYFTEAYKPHLAVFTIALTDDESESEILNLVNFVKKTMVKPLKIQLVRPSKTSSYIFINLDQESKKYINNLHKLCKDYFGDLYLNNALQFFDSRNFELSSEERKLIVKKGSKYDFTPHFTLGKFDPENLERAFEYVNQNFEVQEFEVDSLSITKESEEEKSFPVVEEIRLG